MVVVVAGSSAQWLYISSAWSLKLLIPAVAEVQKQEEVGASLQCRWCSVAMGIYYKVKNPFEKSHMEAAIFRSYTFFRAVKINRLSLSTVITCCELMYSQWQL